MAMGKLMKMQAISAHGEKRSVRGEEEARMGRMSLGKEKICVIEIREHRKKINWRGHRGYRKRKLTGEGIEGIGERKRREGDSVLAIK
jgi:hypothetical protein